MGHKALSAPLVDFDGWHSSIHPKCLIGTDCLQRAALPRPMLSRWDLGSGGLLGIESRFFVWRDGVDAIPAIRFDRPLSQRGIAPIGRCLVLLSLFPVAGRALRRVVSNQKRYSLQQSRTVRTILRPNGSARLPDTQGQGISAKFEGRFNRQILDLRRSSCEKKAKRGPF